MSGALLEIDKLEFGYPAANRRWWERGKRQPILRRVSLDVGHNEAVGLVGESGSGKSTLARCVVRLLEPQAGDIRYESNSILSLHGADLRTYRRQVQIVFQDPQASLNPRYRAADTIAEVLRFHRLVEPGALEGRLAQLWDLVGLDGSISRRFPHELSGGQCQRVGIARALAVQPRLLVCDEPVSALDVSVQAQILNLFRRLREELQISCLFISHDLRVVSGVCERLAVMQDGQIVESGRTRDVLEEPQHPYTQELLRAIPSLEPRCAT